MSKRTRTIIIGAAALMFIGGVMMVIGLLNGAKTSVYWDTEKHRLVCAGDDYEIQEKTAVEQFSKIDIDVSYAEVCLVPSDGYYVEYSVMSDSKAPLTVSDGKLTFRQDSHRFFGIDLDFLRGGDKERKEYLTIYYPEGAEFDSIEAELDMGSMEMSGIYAKSVDVDLAMGSLEVTGTRMDTFQAELDMGSLTMTDIAVSVISAELDMGDLVLSDSAVTGNLDIDLNMGDARLTLARKDSGNPDIEYGYDMETDMGDIEINGADQGKKHSQPGDVMLKISCDMGNIALNLY